MAATAADPAVLATSDGIHFATVAKLPVPVHDAAVAVLDGRIYVFGGDAANGAHAGHPVDTVQMIDPSAHSATVVGSLPAPVTGAAAATLAGVIYVAGGEAAASAAATPTAVKTVWAWLASSRRAVVAGHLEAAAAYAGLTVLGSQAWLVGGESAPGALLRRRADLRAEPERHRGRNWGELIRSRRHDGLRLPAELLEAGVADAEMVCHFVHERRPHPLGHLCLR